MTAKQKKRRKPIDEAYMIPIEPLTHNQQVMFDEWDKGQMIYAYGVAGTGKTFVALYKALKDVLNEYPHPTRSISFAHLLLHERLDFFLEIMKISHLSIKFLTKTWYNPCLKCLMTIHTKCCMIT